MHFRLPSFAIVLMPILFAGSGIARAQAANPPRPAYDFRNPGEVRQWGIERDIARLEATPEGLLVTISGADPYFSGPARSFPPGVPLLLKTRIKSDQGGTFQVFFMGPGEGASEGRSAKVGVPPGVWKDLLIPLPALGAGYKFRLDPPGNAGTCRIDSLSFAQLITVAPPKWPAPTLPALDAAGADAEAHTIRSGSLTLRHSAKEWSGFALSTDGEPMAVGWNRPMIGYLAGASQHPETRWLDIAATARVQTRRDGETLIVEATLDDRDGGRWKLQQRFRPHRIEKTLPFASGAIAVTTEVEVNTPRRPMFLPLLVVLPGVGSFGESKSQGLLAGVEYLDDEPSSSTADLTGPAANRQVVDPAKITFPLMAIQARDRHVGLIWDQAPGVSALFDSPDRLFGSRGHVLGLIAPGAEPTARVDGALFPFEPAVLAPGRPFRAEGILIGGSGTSVVPAIRQYEAIRGLPPRPPLPDAQSFLRLTASGWLDTPIHADGLIRHAMAAGPGFALQPAADASWMLDQLAALAVDKPLADRLSGAANRVAERVPPGQEYHALLGHIRIPTFSLVRGDAAASIEQARQAGYGLLGQFGPDGAVRYPAPKSGTDLGRTHFSREASGHSAHVVAELLRAAVFSGDAGLISEGLIRLRKLDRFADGIPRGAQTWEVPLHTPDILGSADMVRAYLIGYELTGRPDWLEAAKSWAWTGVPFVYLINPTGQAVGPFASIAVLGATQWVAPVWIGLPVQWCGIHYAEAIGRLVRHDPGGPWRALADGITASAIQQVYPAESPHRGLLPDSFDIRSQTRNPADINPGTLQPLAMRLLFGSTSYEMRVLRNHGLIVHAPGGLRDVSEEGETARFAIDGWSNRPASVLIHGLKRAPKRLRLNGQEIPIDKPAPHRFLASNGTVILQVPPSPRRATVELVP